MYPRAPVLRASQYRCWPVLGLALASACSGGQKESTSPPAAIAEPCRTGDLGQCLTEAAAACTPGRAHRLSFDRLPLITVAPGIVRLDHLGGTLLSTDASRWLACLGSCPDHATGPVCFPIDLPFQVSWAVAAGCDVRQIGQGNYGASAARVDVEVRCPGETTQMSLVPELDPVRRDLVAVGAISSSDILAEVEGLAVRLGADGEDHLAVQAVEAASCDDLAIPEGYQVFANSEATGKLAAVSAGPVQALAQELAAIEEAVHVEAVARAKADLLPVFREQFGEACREQGFDPDDDKQLEVCATKRKDTEAPFRAIVARESARLFAERRQQIDELTTRLLVAPICQQFAGQ